MLLHLFDMILRVPSIDGLAAVSIEPGVPTDPLLPLSIDTKLVEVQSDFLYRHHISIMIHNSLNELFVFAVCGIHREAGKLHRNAPEDILFLGFQ